MWEVVKDEFSLFPFPTQKCLRFPTQMKWVDKSIINNPKKISIHTPAVLNFSHTPIAQRTCVAMDNALVPEKWHPALAAGQRLVKQQAALTSKIENMVSKSLCPSKLASHWDNTGWLWWACATSCSWKPKLADPGATDKDSCKCASTTHQSVSLHHLHCL